MRVCAFAARSKQHDPTPNINGNAIYITSDVSSVHITGDVYEHLYTSPVLVRRTHIRRPRKQLEYVDMGYVRRYHESYRRVDMV